MVDLGKHWEKRDSDKKILMCNYCSCSIYCRDEYYKMKLREKSKLEVYQLQCACCNTFFMSNERKKKRSDAGNMVTCSIKCRQILNSRQAVITRKHKKETHGKD